MKRFLFFLTVAMFSTGWLNAQELQTVNLTLEASGNSSVNTVKAIPELKSSAEWTVTATTYYKGVASGEWGSRLFSIQNVPDKDSQFDGFEFYLRPQDFNGATQGQLGLDNVYGKFNTTPFNIDTTNGTLFKFVIESDGSGTISATVTVGDETFDPVTKDNALPMNFVQAAQNYDVEITVEYLPEYLDINPDNVDFGTILVGEEVGPKIVSILGTDESSDKFFVELEEVSGESGAIFIDPESDFNEDTGGEIGLYFNPLEVGECKAILKVTRGDVIKEVELSGTGLSNVPVIISPAVGNPDADTDGNVWYRIRFNKSTGNVLTDSGKDLPIEGTLFDKDNENQLWKFIATAEDNKFKLVSKNGREVGHSLVTQEEEEEIGIFISVESSPNTFSFQLRPDADWQMIWNEFEPEVEKANHVAYLHNANNSNYVSSDYSSKNELDDGNSLKFYLASEIFGPDLPEFSTNEKEVWYYIQFDRRADVNKVWQELPEIVDDYEDIYTALYTNVIQMEKSEDESQYWKFIGDKDNFMIVSYTNSAIALDLPPETTGSRMITVDLSEGNVFSFDMPYNNESYRFQLKNELEGEGANYFYVNDYQGKAACQYLVNDAGNYVTFIPVNPGTSIKDVNVEDAIKDPIVATQYYTIQGTLLGGKPGVEGVYIEKRIHESKKISAVKVYISGK